MAAWLVLEDEPDVYEMMMHITQLLGIEGIAFVDAEEAIAWIDDVDDQVYMGMMPDVAILDIRMPGNFNGLDVSARLRQSPLLSGIPILLITAYRLNVSEEAEVMNYSGADKLIYKPLPAPKELKSLIDHMLEQQKL